MFKISLRKLAYLRIGLGLTMLFDFLDRASVFRLHFTELGIYPYRFPFGEFPQFSIFHLSGSLEFQAGLFLVGCLAALLFTLGIATRFAGIVCWLILLNLQHYAYLSQFSADDVLRLLLFWSLFLPLDSRFTLNPFAKSKERTQFVENWATAALLAQVAAIFIFAGVNKIIDPGWRSGVALQLAIEAFGTRFATWLLGYPTLLSALTLLTIPVQLVSSFLLFSSARLRVYGAWALIGFQIMLALFLNLSFFPAVTIVGLMLFLPDQRFERPTERWRIVSKKLVATAICVGLIVPAFGQFGALGIIGLNQNWNMFAPPPQRVIWIVAKMNASDGRIYEAATKKEFTDWSATRFASVPAGIRWAGLFYKVPQNPWIAHRIGVSLCRYWKEDRPNTEIKSADVYFVIQNIDRRPQTIEPQLLETVSCDGH